MGLKVTLTFILCRAVARWTCGHAGHGIGREDYINRTVSSIRELSFITLAYNLIICVGNSCREIIRYTRLQTVFILMGLYCYTRRSSYYSLHNMLESLTLVILTYLQNHSSILIRFENSVFQGYVDMCMNDQNPKDDSSSLETFPLRKLSKI